MSQKRYLHIRKIGGVGSGVKGSWDDAYPRTIGPGAMWGDFVNIWSLSKYYYIGRKFNEVGGLCGQKMKVLANKTANFKDPRIWV